MRCDVRVPVAVRVVPCLIKQDKMDSPECTSTSAFDTVQDLNASDQELRTWYCRSRVQGSLAPQPREQGIRKV